MSRLQGLLLVLALQALVIFAPYAQHYYVRYTGTEVWLPMRLQDPRDVLRGHYVRLQSVQENVWLDAQQCALLRGERSENHDYYWDVQVVDGQAVIVGLRPEPPAEGLFIKMPAEQIRPSYGYGDVCSGYGENASAKRFAVTIRLPFGRYYANEYRAQSWEREGQPFLLQLWLKNGAWSLGELKPQS